MVMRCCIVGGGSLSPLEARPDAAQPAVRWRMRWAPSPLASDYDAANKAMRCPARYDRGAAAASRRRPAGEAISSSAKRFRPISFANVPERSAK
jgi:hypothetical protein